MLKHYCRQYCTALRQKLAGVDGDARWLTGFGEAVEAQVSVLQDAALPWCTFHRRGRPARVPPSGRQAGILTVHKLLVHAAAAGHPCRAPSVALDSDDDEVRALWRIGGACGVVRPVGSLGHHMQVAPEVQ